MSEKETDEQLSISRRGALECMIWAGTGILWTLSAGVPKSLSLLGDARRPRRAASLSCRSATAMSASTSRPTPTPSAPSRKPSARSASSPAKPAFMIHTGDITHLSKPEEFDNADKVIGGAGLDVHYVPGEHDYIDEGRGKAYLDRYGKGSKGAGWYSFDDHGVHFIGLVNVVDLKAGGLGRLGADQLAWLADDLKGKAASTPIVVFAHIPLWTVYADWGWGTDDGMQALQLLKGFGSVTVLNGHIHQIVQKVEGNMVFHTARSTAFPQPEPGKAKGPGPMTVPADQLRCLLGISSVDVCAPATAARHHRHHARPERIRYRPEEE